MRGSVRDIGPILITAAVLIILTMLVAVFYGVFKPAVQSLDTRGDTTDVFNRADQVINNLVNLPAMVIILMGIASIVLAFFIPSHPIFLPASLIFWIFYIFLATAFSNMLWEFINNQAIVTTANQFPLIVWIVKYLPYEVAILGAAIMIIMYGKRPI